MKKILIMILAAVMLFSLASCTPGGNGEITTEPVADNTTDNTASTDTTETKDSKYGFAVAAAKGFVVKVDMNMKDVLAALGEPLKYEESPSCAFEGLDKSYTYSGFVISTRPDGENDFVLTIILTDDSVTTPEDIFLGMDAASVKAAYGTPASESETVLSYKDDVTCLNFILKDGIITSIEYLPVS